MVHVIITFRTLLWSIVSLIALMIMFLALMNPKWLVGRVENVTIGNVTYDFEQSVGVYTKCGKPLRKDVYRGPSCTIIAVDGFATDSEVYPNTWKVSMFFISLGLTIMLVSVILAFFSFCFQSIQKKSIYNIVGTIQASAGAIFIMGTMIYPMGWMSNRVIKLCGVEVSYYYVGDCDIGIGIILVVIGIALTFVSAGLSILADKSSTSSSVEHQIIEGQTLVCAV